MTAPLHRDPLGESLFEASEDCVKLLGLDGTLQGMNANGRCLMEIDDFTPLRGVAWASLWPAAEQPKIAAAVAHSGRGQVARFTADCPTAKGTPKSWDVIVSPVIDDAGRVVRLVSISRDVTELATVEAENVLLARELSHRIRNMFAVVDGVISLSARGAADVVQPFATSLRERLIGLGRALAYVSPDALADANHVADQTLQGLLHVLLAPYGNESGQQGRIAIAGHDRTIGRSATTSLALLVNELATNALKYGALGSPQGRVTLNVTATETEVVLAWEEQGAGTPPPRALKAGDGFGTTLIDNAVRRQLGGSLVREWGPNGLIVRVSLPSAKLSR